MHDRVITRSLKLPNSIAKKVYSRFGTENWWKNFGGSSSSGYGLLAEFASYQKSEDRTIQQLFNVCQKLIQKHQTKTWEKDEASWKKLTERLICLNRYLFLVTHSPSKNVQRLGCVFFAVPALRSGDYAETCGIYREEHLCGCYMLPDLEKTN